MCTSSTTPSEQAARATTSQSPRITARIPRLLRPHLDFRASAAGKVLVAELDPLDDAVIAGKIDRTRPRVLAEELVDLGTERLAAPELHTELDHLEVAVDDDEHELAELALVAPDE